MPLLNSEKALKEGGFYDLMWLNYNNPLFDSAHQYAFLRYDGKDVIMVVANFDNKDVNITVDITNDVLNFLHIEMAQKGKTINLLDKNIKEENFTHHINISIPALDGKILKYKF